MTDADNLLKSAYDAALEKPQITECKSPLSMKIQPDHWTQSSRNQKVTKVSTPLC